MKLDKIRFARLISVISRITGYPLPVEDIEAIDHIVTVDMPQPEAVYPMTSEINNLMLHMANGTQKIEAIKTYRTLTGLGLKESTDAVEKYWQPANDMSDFPVAQNY